MPNSNQSLDAIHKELIRIIQEAPGQINTEIDRLEKYARENSEERSKPLRLFQKTTPDEPLIFRVEGRHLPFGFEFDNCNFKTFTISKTTLGDRLNFKNCTFDVLEISNLKALKQLTFENCNFTSEATVLEPACSSLVVKMSRRNASGSLVIHAESVRELQIELEHNEIPIQIKKSKIGEILLTDLVAETTIQDSAIRKLQIITKLNPDAKLEINDSTIDLLTAKSSAQIDGRWKLKGTTIGEMRFENVDCQKGTLLFDQCTFKRAPIFFGAKFSPRTDFFRCNFEGDNNQDSEFAYRYLKKAMADLHNDSAALEFGAHELRARRWRWLPLTERILSNCYGFLNGYGQDLLRPIIVLAFLFIGCTGVYSWEDNIILTLGENTQESWLTEKFFGLYFCRGLFVSFCCLLPPFRFLINGVSFFPSEPWLALIIPLQSVCSTIVIFLFLISVRRRFRIIT